jgi:phenylpropionate dioxygenase-like ring-hydroxylating dioxygenase large terminal subunit
MTPAQLDGSGRAELLRSMIAELDDTMERGLVLPPHWYTDAEIFAVEQPIVTRQTWQYVGHADQLPAPGHFITNRIGDVPVVVVQTDGGYRGYVNVCRHRGHLVAMGQQGTCSSLQCRYHGWTWSLDGELKGVPRAEREPDFDRSAWPLVPIQVGTWGNLVFACVDLGAPSFEEVLGDLPQHALDRGHDPSAYRLVRHDDLELPCNWKVFNDNMVECYHCPTGHPAFRELYSVEPENYTLEVHNTCGFHSASLKDNQKSKAYAEMLGQFEFYFMFPTTMIMYHEIAEVMLVATPLAPERTSFYIEYHYRPDADPEMVRAFEEWYAPLWLEDMALITAVQEGIRAGAVPPGPLLLDSEVIVHQCQRWLRDALAHGLQRLEAETSIPV